ncbi:MAG: STAS domain-containing protein [Pseudomonadota bacterium]
MKLTYKTDGPVDVIVVEADRIDSASAVAFKDAFQTETQSGQRDVVLDLGQVAFLDSSGLGAVVGAQKILGKSRNLELANLHDAVAKVMTLTRMDTVFRIHKDIAEANASHGSSAA